MSDELKKKTVEKFDYQAHQKNLTDLKYDLSLAIVAYRCRQLGCDASEYGQIYNSEIHEQLLNTLVRFIAASYEDTPTPPRKEEA